MNAVVGERPGTPGSASRPESAPAPFTSQPSKVLPELWQRLPGDGCLTVLELGRALPETIAFFSGRRCRIHVVDLFGELVAGTFDSATGTTLERTFQNLFGFPSGTRLDLCLLWDLPHYLDERRLRAFSRALWPWLAPSTLAHAFGVHSAGTVLLNREYGILGPDSISLRSRRGAQPDCRPHPPSFMNEWLTCFSTARGVLLGDGRVESMMAARL